MIRLVHGDNAAVLPTLPDASFALIYVDPPYNTGNKDFVYEISCDQMCGNGHYSMKGIIKVVTKSEFILWRAQQKTAYSEIKPATETPAPAAVVTMK